MWCIALSKWSVHYYTLYSLGIQESVVGGRGAGTRGAGGAYAPPAFLSRGAGGAEVPFWVDKHQYFSSKFRPKMPPNGTLFSNFLHWRGDRKRLCPFRLKNHRFYPIFCRIWTKNEPYQFLFKKNAKAFRAISPPSPPQLPSTQCDW